MSLYCYLFTRLLSDNSNSFTYEPRKGAKSNTFTWQLCDCTSHADWLFRVIIVTWTYEGLFRFVTNTLKKALVFKEAIAFKTWRIKLSELKTVSLSRIESENLVNYDVQPSTTMIKILVFRNFSVFDESHFLKKLGENLGGFFLINVWWVDIYCTSTICLTRTRCIRERQRKVNT